MTNIPIPERPSRRLAELILTYLETQGYGIQSARDESNTSAFMVIREKATNTYLRINISEGSKT